MGASTSWRPKGLSTPVMEQIGFKKYIIVSMLLLLLLLLIIIIM